jgi:hypothetical protein
MTQHANVERMGFKMRIAVLLLMAGCTPRRQKPFECGEQRCDARTSYCEMIKTDVPALPSTFTCKPLPDSCLSPAAGCDCFPAHTRCDYCVVLDSGGARHFQRTCIGGR